MRLFNLNIEPSAATRRDWRHVCEAFREFWDKPTISLLAVFALAIVLFFLVGPWVL